MQFFTVPPCVPPWLELAVLPTNVQLFSVLSYAPPPITAELPVMAQLLSVPLNAPPPWKLAELLVSVQLFSVP